jgi:uncharacterized protein (TIGR03437 family)
MAAWLLGLVAATAASAQPFVYSAVNSASYDRSGIAQGSLFVVFGANIGPAQIAQAGSLPLPIKVGETSITVTYGATTMNCPMIYALAGQAAAILPSVVPPGPASLTLTYNGMQSPFPVAVNVLPAAAGLFTLGSSGFGPGVFTALDNSANTFAATAKPGDILTAWATGLGPVGGPDDVLPVSFPNFAGVEIFAGTQAARIVYAGRSGCCVGVDQISFVVPPGITGCYVPVAVRSGGKISNFVTIAINGAGAPCADAAPTVPPSLVTRAIGGLPVKAGVIAIGPVAILRGLGFNPRRGVAEKLAELLGVKVSDEDAAAIIRALRSGNRRALLRAMAKFSNAWKALDSSTRAAIRAVSLNQQGAVAGFGQYSSVGTLASAMGALFPSQGTCTTIGPMGGLLGASSLGLNAGSSLSLTGHAGSWTLALFSSGQYQATFGSTPSGPEVPAGQYFLDGSGGKDIGAFHATLNIAGNIVWTNKASIATVDRSQPLTLTWTGGSAPGSVLIGGYSQAENRSESIFACAEDASKGSFTIPSFILSTLGASSGAVFIGSHPLSQKAVIPGIDLAYFVDGSSDSKTILFR